jgi:hypothetical protein
VYGRDLEWDYSGNESQTWNLPLCKQLSFYFSMGTWEHIKLGELPRHNTLRVPLLGEIPQNTHRNKKGLVYIEGNKPSTYTRNFRPGLYTFLRNQGQLFGSAH